MTQNRLLTLCVVCLLTELVLAPSSQAQPFKDPGFGDPTTLTPAANPAAAVLNGSTLPTAPAFPGSPVRPNTWPGGAPTPVPGYEPAAARPTAGAPAAQFAAAITAPKKSPADPPYDPAEILARVGAERIQACEVLPMVNRAIHKAVDSNEQFQQLSPQDKQKAIYEAQKSYVQMALKDMIGTKLLVAELRAAADKKALTENEKKIRDYFNTDYMKQLLKEYEASSIIELENKLRALGGSIESQRALFVDQNLAAGWLGQAVRREDKTPTHDEMLAYYEKNAEQWDTPARVRWEQLTARWMNFRSRDEARAALATWGDDVLVRGVPLAQVAKAHSQDHAADDGGLHDWVSKGSLRSAVLETALFSLPIGAMSKMIEDEDGCHIVRVLEREDANRTPFTEVQPEIKQALHDGGEAQRRTEYIDKLRSSTPVWTVFDDEPGANSRMR